MKAYLSLLLTSALIFGAASLAFGDDSSKNGTSAGHASSGHRSHSSTHHHSTGSHRSSGSTGSKTHSNVPSN